MLLAISLKPLLVLYLEGLIIILGSLGFIGGGGFGEADGGDMVLGAAFGGSTGLGID